MTTEIFRTLAGSRLYGTYTDQSDHDYKAVHLPTAKQILLGKRKDVINTSTGGDTTKNGADDVDVESFELQRFLQLASGMQTAAVELLFVPDGLMRPFDGYRVNYTYGPIWGEVLANRHRILNNNPKSFVGYCKSQAVRYSMRGDRLKAYSRLCDMLFAVSDSKHHKVGDYAHVFLGIPEVNEVVKTHGNKQLKYLDLYGRQVPYTLQCSEALKIYSKPVEMSGSRAKAAMEAGGADWKALYHALRIVEQGITLFKAGYIEFPAFNREYLMEVRAGRVEMDEVLDVFDQRLEILTEIGENSPLAPEADQEWIDGFVEEQYRKIVLAE